MPEKLLEPGESVEYVRNVSSPPAQKGAAGETRVVGQTISKFAARLLHKGGHVKRIEPQSERRSIGGRTDGKADQGKVAGEKE